MHDLTLLIGTCDEYSFLWNNFITLCDKFFEPNCKKIIVSETKKQHYDNYEFHCFGHDHWSNRIAKSLDTIDSEYVFFVLDDYYFSEKITENFLQNSIQFLKENNANKLIITPSHINNTFEIFYKLTHIQNNLYKQNDDSNYLTSIQPAIWKKNFFKKCLHPNWTPWQFELIGSELIKNQDNKIYLHDVQKSIYFNAVRRGKVMSEGWQEFYKQHNLTHSPMNTIKKENWLAANSSEFFNECESITNNTNKFNNFKRNDLFCTIIGNDVRSEHIANQCFDKIKHSSVLNQIEKFKENDKYGNPIILQFPEIENISIGTLYFIHILNDLLLKFNNIQNLNVIEIGSGYGGQAKIILDHGVKTYTCVDVKQPLNLCRKYISLFNYNNINYINTDDISQNNFDNYDLVISNWCLSEFDNQGIEFYIDTIIKNCKLGYFLMNCWDIEKQNFIKYKLSNHFKIEVFPEEIQTHQSGKNFLLVLHKL